MGGGLQQPDSDRLDDVGGTSDGVLDDAPTSSVAMAMMFGSITFATSSVAARLWLTGMWSHRNGISGDKISVANAMGRSTPLDVSSLPSIYSLLYHSTVFGLILFYSYICERHPPFFHEEKTYDRDEVSCITRRIFFLIIYPCLLS